MKYLISLYLFTLVGARPELPPRAVGSSCKTPDGSGTCQSTSSCKGMSIPGPLPGHCPNDPNDVQCCVVKTCTPPGQTGICQNTNKPCAGGPYNSGNYCPGDNTIQCCPTTSSSAPPPHQSPDKSSTNTCTHPQPNTCTFYPNCLESKYHCGPSGYPLGYGLHYCEKFSAAKLSPRGRSWVTKTMLCLQDALVPYATTQSTTCSALKETAFASHPHCYVSSGVCTLPPSDWLVIVETVSPKDLFGGVDNLKAVLETADGCADFYAWLIEQGIVKVVDEVVDAGKDLWHKVTGWF